mmetsp:Transcript_11898/g.21526  ORF Transcript_11898/g.21526 Transcript_11898/m.21526 type:complete len:293 (-) Transcript_11898:697-1575(-)
MASKEDKIIDGKWIAADIRKEIADDVKKLNVTPGLATVLVGNRTDSATYVRMKHKACAEVGIQSIHKELPETIAQSELIQHIDELNSNPQVHGILIQLPLPSHIDEEAVLSRVSLNKDVDGFHPLNIGHLALKDRTPLFVPCTPQGVMELLKRCNVSLQGKHAVVLGRSNIVGLPVSLLLLAENATVTICHSRTQDIASVIRQADVLVAAVGRAEMVKGDWIKEGAVVIDVGMNSKDDKNEKKGYKLVGDVDYDACYGNASMITPVPGGVGPMTIAMLLRNCVNAAILQQDQ